MSRRSRKKAERASWFNMLVHAAFVVFILLWFSGALARERAGYAAGDLAAACFRAGHYRVGDWLEWCEARIAGR